MKTFLFVAFFSALSVFASFDLSASEYYGWRGESRLLVSNSGRGFLARTFNRIDDRSEGADEYFPLLSELNKDQGFCVGMNSKEPSSLVEAICTDRHTRERVKSLLLSGNGDRAVTLAAEGAGINGIKIGTGLGVALGCCFSTCCCSWLCCAAGAGFKFLAETLYQS